MGTALLQIAVAMSGGVDSGLAAALLKEAGHEILGVYMRLVGERASPPLRPSDPTDAQRVADCLRIPLHILDFTDSLEALIAYLCSEYDAGRTPNPCVLCNRWNKFGRLLREAQHLGAERLATGHYARITPGGARASDEPCSIINAERGTRNAERGPEREVTRGEGDEEEMRAACRVPRDQAQTGIPPQATCLLPSCHASRVTRHASPVLAPDRRFLLRARHRAKDQSYMLFGLTQPQLACALFPLGEFRKEDVRRMARERGLPVHERAESQDICFLPDREYMALLRRRLGDRIQPGPILDTAGRILGTHSGCQGFTIGQRRGLGVALGTPRYVVRIDRAANAVIIGTREELRREAMLVSQVNCIAFGEPPRAIEASVQIRYNHQPVPALIEPLPDGGARVAFREPEYGVTPGQAAVFYADDLVLGGGWIEG